MRSYWTDGLTWGCNAGMFVFGIVLAVLGASLPLLVETAGLDPAQAGSLFLFLNLGALIITLSSGPVFDRFGFKWILVNSSLLAAASFFILASANTYVLMATASLVLGFGGGGLNAGANALIADLYPHRPAAALNRVGIFFGIGTFFIPLFIGTLLATFSLRTIFIVTGLIGLTPAVLFMKYPSPRPKHAAGFPLFEAASLFKNPFVLMTGILLFFQSGNEITTSGWMTTFLVDQVSMSPSWASIYLSIFWAALIAGRLAAGRLLQKVGEATLVQLSATSAALFLALFILFPHPLYSLLLAALVGFSMASIFPTVLGEASGRYPSLSGTVIGILISIALVGGMLVPWIAGILVSRLGTPAALVLPVFGFLAVATIQTLLKRRRT